LGTVSINLTVPHLLYAFAKAATPSDSTCAEIAAESDAAIFVNSPVSHASTVTFFLDTSANSIARLTVSFRHVIIGLDIKLRAFQRRLDYRNILIALCLINF